MLHLLNSINIVNNTDYINALGKYADSELVKKININEGDTIPFIAILMYISSVRMKVLLINGSPKAKGCILSIMQLHLVR